MHEWVPLFLPSSISRPQQGKAFTVWKGQISYFSQVSKMDDDGASQQPCRSKAPISNADLTPECNTHTHTLTQNNTQRRASCSLPFFLFLSFFTCFLRDFFPTSINQV